MKPPIPTQLQIIKEKWGVKAFEDLMEIYSKMYMQIEELEKSRDNWKKRYMGVEKK